MSTESDPDLPPSSKYQVIPKSPPSGYASVTQKDISLSPVLKKEVPYLAQIYMKAYRGIEKYGEPCRDKAARYLWRLFRNCPHYFFKVQINGRIAGFIACDPNWYEIGHSKVMEIHELVVDPDWQKHGLGGRLIGFAADLASNMGRKIISLWAGEGNTRAINWYIKKLGFVKDRKEGIWIHMHRPVQLSGFQ